MSIQIEITKPIKGLDGEETRVLTFQEPTFADLIKMEEVGGKSAKQLRTLMCSCSTYPEHELNKLTPADVMVIGEKLMSFLDFPEPTTKK